MTGRPRWRHDLATTTVGFGLVGLSAFVFLAAGPRLLGDDGFSVAAVAWATATIIGIGVGLPGEQAITRALAGEPPASPAPVVRRLAGVTVATLLLPLLDLLGVPVLGLTGVWAVSVPVAALGWTLAAWQRGRCGGAGRFGAYSVSLMVEAVTRIGLVGVAWVWPAAAPGVLALAIGLPVLASAVAARLGLGPIPAASHAQSGSAGVDDHLSFTGVALLIQLTVNLPVLWLQWRAPGTAGAGLLTAVLTYFRVPLLLVGGIAATALSAVSRSEAAGEHAAAVHRAYRSLVLAAGVGAGAVAALAAVSGPLLSLYYGSPLTLPPGQTVLLALGSLLLIVASVATPVAYAFGLSRTVLAAWAAGTVLLVAMLAAAPTGVGGAAAALVVGPGVALALLLWLMWRRAFQATPVG